MLEEILDIRNVKKALEQVVANKGAGGIDGMQVEELAATSMQTGKRYGKIF